MPSEVSSSSLPSASSSPVPSSSLCETDQETLRSEYELKSADPCPVCTLPIGRHLRRPIPPSSSSTAASTASSHSSSQLGKNTTLPRWKVDYHQAKPFLDKIEHLLLADGVDVSVWPRLLLKAIPNVHESSWVVNNIVNPGVDWQRARTLFTSHFEVFSYSAQLKKEYAVCRQRPKESVQIYSDRFMDLITQLSYDDSNELVIDHYVEGLSPHYNAEFLRHLTTIRLVKDDREFAFTSLKAVVDVTLALERIDRTANGLAFSGSSSSSALNFTEAPMSSTERTSTASPDKTPSSSSSSPPSSSESLQWRKRDEPSSGSSSSQSSGSFSSQPPQSQSVVLTRQGTPVRCHACDGNHFANDPSCPRRSDRVTRSAAAQNSTPSSSQSSSAPSSAAPATSSPTASASAPPPIRLNSVSLTDGRTASSSSIISCGSVSLLASTTATSPEPLAVYLTGQFSNRVFSTLIDTGAEVSFADSSLITSLGLPIASPHHGGKIRMAQQDILTDRVGSVDLAVTALFPSTDRDSISFRYPFELMSFHGGGNKYHFIIGQDLIRVLFPQGVPLSYLPQQTSPPVAVVASSTLVESLTVPLDVDTLSSLPPIPFICQSDRITPDYPDLSTSFQPQSPETTTMIKPSSYRTDSQFALSRTRCFDVSRPLYEVHSILDHRGSPGFYEYLVRWKGYDNPTDNSWEPLSSFVDDSVLHSYWSYRST
jgi:hypothetical protein